MQQPIWTRRRILIKVIGVIVGGLLVMTLPSKLAPTKKQGRRVIELKRLSDSAVLNVSDGERNSTVQIEHLTYEEFNSGIKKVGLWDPFVKHFEEAANTPISECYWPPLPSSLDWMKRNGVLGTPGECQVAGKEWGMNLKSGELRKWSKCKVHQKRCPGSIFSLIETAVHDENEPFQWVLRTKCPRAMNPRWGVARTEINREFTNWNNQASESTVVVDAQGIDWIYTSCTFPWGETQENLHFVPVPRQISSEKKLQDPVLCLNVLVLTMDALGRNHYLRSLPSVVTWLNAHRPHTSAQQGSHTSTSKQRFLYFDFQYTNVFGESSAANTPRLFCGSKSCATHEYATNVVNVFNEAGFVTGWGDEYVVRDYLRSDRASPDHELDGHTFFKKNYGGSSKGEVFTVRELYHWNDVPGCRHGKMMLEREFEYLERFLELGGGVPGRPYSRFNQFFSFIFYGAHTSDMNAFSQYDEFIYKRLSKWETSGVLDNAVVFLNSDHGIHRTAYTKLLSGEIERRQATLGMLIGRKIIDRFPEIEEVLSGNQDKLTTQLDAYRTVVGFAQRVAQAQKDKDKGRSLEKVDSLLKRLDRSNSFDLTRDAVPVDRTCSQANVPAKWCQCYRPKESFIGGQVKRTN